MIRETRILAGTSIDRAAVELVEAAGQSRTGKAWAMFNGVRVEAERDSDPAAIVSRWRQEFDRKAEAYRASPEGIAAAQAAEQRVRDLQAEHDSLVHELASIDPKDDVRILDWLCRLQPCSDHIGVNVDRDTIVWVFEGAGFRANANTGLAYRGDDRENSFRYLVGQALDGLKNGPAIHGVLHKFVGEWRDKFPSPSLRSSTLIAGGRV